MPLVIDAEHDTLVTMNSPFLYRATVSSICLALLAVPACSGKSIVDAPSDTSTNTSTSTGTGTGTGTGTNSSTSTSTSTTTLSCKGWDDPVCGPEGFCATSPDSCGGPGECEPRPTECDDGCSGVCGCDEEFHCSVCAANAKGVAVKDGDCAQEKAYYQAKLWLGGLDHLIINKKDAAAGTCLILYADWPTMSTPELAIKAPEGWGVSQLIVSNLPSDCDSFETQLKGEVVQASAAKGEIKWTVDPGKYYPCELDIDAAVQFDKPPPWLQGSHVMVSHIKVQDGCF